MFTVLFNPVYETETQRWKRAKCSISFAIWQIFVWPSHAVRSNTLYALNRLIDSYRFFYESSRYLAGFPKAYLFSYYAAHWETAYCKYTSQKTIAFWAMVFMIGSDILLLTLEPKGWHTYESGFHQSHFRPHFLTTVTASTPDKTVKTIPSIF